MKIFIQVLLQVFLLVAGCDAFVGQPNQTPQAVRQDPRVKEELELEKLRLEIAALRQQHWWSQYLPGGLAVLGLAAGLITAWKVGVFESRSNFLKAENAALEARKHTLQAEIAKFEDDKKTLLSEIEAVRANNAELVAIAEFAAFIEKVRSERTVKSSAVQDLVALLARQDERQSERTELLASVFEREQDAVVKGLLAYALFLGTRDARWRDLLFGLLSANVATLDRIESLDALGDIFGDSHWSDDERPHVAATLMRHVDAPEASPKRQLLLLIQIGRLHEGTLWNYEGSPIPTTFFRLDHSSPELFVRAVIIARNLALAGASEDAFVALSRFAPPALLAVTGTFIGSLDFSTGDVSGPAPTLQSCVNYANENVVDTLRGPRVYDENSTIMGRKRNEFRIQVKRAWTEWNINHATFVALWMEPNLATFRQAPEKYTTMFDYHYRSQDHGW